jgi:hypothetical protein
VLHVQPGLIIILFILSTLVIRSSKFVLNVVACGGFHRFMMKIDLNKTRDWVRLNYQWMILNLRSVWVLNTTNACKNQNRNPHSEYNSQIYCYNVHSNCAESINTNISKCTWTAESYNPTSKCQLHHPKHSLSRGKKLVIQYNLIANVNCKVMQHFQGSQGQVRLHK